MEDWSSFSVWSDDGAAVVGVYEYFEGKYSVTRTRQRNIESEVYLMTYGEHTGDPLLKFPRSDGRVRALYFMREQGYLIVERENHLEELDDGMNETAVFYVDRVSSDGTVTSLGAIQALTMISCDPEGTSATTTGHVLSVFPNPAGTILAEVKTETTCNDQTAYIRFLDPHTLEVLDGPFAHSNPRPALGMTDYAWLETGRFALGQPGFNGLTGHTFAPNTQPEPLGAIDYDCFFPPTTSSDTNQDGQWVGVNEGVVEVQQPALSSLSFGCP
jgi:hypothetical protein